MNPHELPEFIVIDDDPINNVICQKLIEMTIPGSKVWTFREAEPGLAHLASYEPDNLRKKVLFLDIAMPAYSGWDVLKDIENRQNESTHDFDIYILTTSLDHRDMDQALKNKLVSGFIAKPLTRARIVALFPEYIALSNSSLSDGLTSTHI